MELFQHFDSAKLIAISLSTPESRPLPRDGFSFGLSAVEQEFDWLYRVMACRLCPESMTLDYPMIPITNFTNTGQMIIFKPEK